MKYRNKYHAYSEQKRELDAMKNRLANAIDIAIVAFVLILGIFSLLN